MKYSEMGKITSDLITHAQCVEVRARAASAAESYDIECEASRFILYLATDLINDYVRSSLTMSDANNKNAPEYCATLYKSAAIAMDILTQAAGKYDDTDILAAIMHRLDKE